jgi:hypothetical protein
MVVTGPGIAAGVLKVKPIWVVFHDELYLEIVSEAIFCSTALD